MLVLLYVCYLFPNHPKPSVHTVWIKTTGDPEGEWHVTRDRKRSKLQPKLQNMRSCVELLSSLEPQVPLILLYNLTGILQQNLPTS